LTGADNAGLK